MAFLAGENLTASALNAVTDPPLLFAYQIVTQSLLNSTWTAVTMTAEVVDTISGHSLVTNTSRYTPNVSGTYEVYGQVAFAINATGDRGAQFRKNGAVTDGLQYGAARAMSGGNFAGIAVTSGMVNLNGSTDYIEVYAFQDSGGTISTSYGAGFTTSFMQIRRIGS